MGIGMGTGMGTGMGIGIDNLFYQVRVIAGRYSGYSGRHNGLL